MDQQSLRVQWIQLIVLSGVHFLVDMFGNVLPAILPVICREFTITLVVGGFVLASLPLASNTIQLLTGHLRSDKRQPFFLHIGVVLAAGISLMMLAPRTSGGVVLLIALGLISGAGIAIAHPEGLRAVHTLDRISPALSTAVFMTSGFMGYASGGVISAGLVAAYGLKGLYPLVLCPIAGIVAILLSRVRLAVDPGPAPGGGGPKAQAPRSIPFWAVLLTGLPAGISTTVVLQLAPTYLNEIGYELTFGGFSTATFGWGSVAGPFFWAVVARKKGDLSCSVWAFLLSAPFMVLYLVFIRHAAAAWLLFGVGFFSMSAYVLTITLARNAHGLNLGQRMAFILGGTWGISMVIFLALVPVADWVGAGAVLRFTPAGYVLSGLLALYVLRRYPQAARRHPAAEVLEAAEEGHTPV